MVEYETKDAAIASAQTLSKTTHSTMTVYETDCHIANEYIVVNGVIQSMRNTFTFIKQFKNGVAA